MARLGRPRGNRGEIVASGYEQGAAAFCALKSVWLLAPGGCTPAEHGIESAWEHNGRLIVKFRGVDSISAAEQIRGAEVRIPRSKRPPAPPGEYYHSDLAGCEVVKDGTGEPVGRVTGVVEFGDSVLLELEGGVQVPFARDICVEVDPANKRIRVDVPEGLLDLNRK